MMTIKAPCRDCGTMIDSSEAIAVLTYDQRPAFQCSPCARDQYRATQSLRIAQRMTEGCGILHVDARWLLETVTQLREELREARRGR